MDDFDISSLGALGGVIPARNVTADPTPGQSEKPDPRSTPGWGSIPGSTAIEPLAIEQGMSTEEVESELRMRWADNYDQNFELIGAATHRWFSDRPALFQKIAGAIGNDPDALELLLDIVQGRR